MSQFDKFGPGVELPEGSVLKKLYADLARHLNEKVEDQQKYKDLMNRILVKAMGKQPPIVVAQKHVAPLAAPLDTPNVPFVKANKPFSAELTSKKNIDIDNDLLLFK